jgi:1-acyl-sn-glycerol-3-phosphate acyltransferase
LASGVPITPLANWGSQAVWQKSGKGSLKYGRPVWLRVGGPIDLSGRRGEADDPAAVRAMTDGVMDTLTTMVVDLRDHYPERWSDQG